MAHDPIRPKQWNPKLPDELDAWVMSMLAREMADRLGDADEARRQLRRLLDVRTVSGPQVAVPGGAQGPIPRGSLGGVVPKKSWAGPKPSADEKSSDVSTEDHYSPFAQTQGALPLPDMTPPNRTVPYGHAVPDHLKQTSPLPVMREVPDVTLRPGQLRAGAGHDTDPMAPEQPPAVTPPAFTPPEPAPTLLLRPGEGTAPPVTVLRPPEPGATLLMPPGSARPPPEADGGDESLALPPSRLPLVLALIGTITALLGGLWWLFSMK